MTIAQFIAWEERQEMRWEFDGLRATAMDGGTINHEAIGNRLRFLLLDRLSGTSCSVSGPGLKVATQSGIRYPDALITCTRAEGSATIAPEPVVLFEVLSSSTGGTDRIVKLREYQRIPSVMHYVMLEQGRIGAMIVSRRTDQSWTAVALAEADTIDFPEFGIRLPLAAVYRDVDLDPDTLE